MTLVDAEDNSAKGKCIAHRCKDGKEAGDIKFSQLFVLGHR